MKVIIVIFFITFDLLITVTLYGSALSDSTLLISVDPPSYRINGVVQNINYQSTFSENVSIRLTCYQVRESKKLAVYDLLFKNKHVVKGVGNILLPFNHNATLYQADYSFYEVLKNFKLMPPGNYEMRVVFNNQEDSVLLKEDVKWYVDSTLSGYSPLRTRINKKILNLKPGKRKRSISKKVNNPQLSKKTFNHLNRRLNKKISSKEGVTSVPTERNGKKYSALYYGNWFLGYYELLATPDLKERIAREKKLLQKTPSALVSNDLEGFTSISSQVRKLNRKDTEQGLSGSLDLLSNLSTGQQTGSAQNNNYQEVYANVNTSILSIPVVIEGYATTQDMNRKAKASYIRIRYDAHRNKAQIRQSVSDYTHKYAQAKAKGAGLRQTYSALIKRWIAEQQRSESEFMREYGVDIQELEKYKGDVHKMLTDSKQQAIQIATDSVKDKMSGGDSVRKKLERDREKVNEHYKNWWSDKKKIEKYQKLLQQFERQQYLDSLLVNEKLKAVKKVQDVSGKRLAKAAEHILPPGKASSILNSITRLEVGILNTYESAYTIAGQKLNGGCVGYDLGGVIVSGSVGKTQYVSRDGNVDKYNSTMIRADLAPTDNRKVGIVYYTYTPTRQMYIDTSFIHGDVLSLPTFSKVTHIVSIPYEVAITKNLRINGEGAISYKKSERSVVVNNNSAAYKTAITYHIPSTPINTSGEWEHVGKYFNNSALPFPKQGVDRYTIASDAMVFKSLVKVGVQFNYLRQASFASSGYNMKWGFDLSSHFRRYPNIHLSYKPFSTFRKFNDTLAIKQRPLMGAVWLARGNYRIRRPRVTHRILLTYNSNSSTVDTESYSCTTIQGSYLLSDKKNMLSTGLGWMKQPGSVGQIPGGTAMNNYMFNITYNRSLNSSIDVNVGDNLCMADFGVQRHALTAGVRYRFNLPVTARVMVRHSTFRQFESSAAQRIWSCQLGCSWQIK